MTTATNDALTLLPDHLRASIPPLYAQDGMGMNATVHLHLFGPAGDWWITEVSDDGTEAFGYTRLAAMPDCAELGYISLTELQSITDAFKADPARNLRCLIERDLHWTPCALSHVIAHH